MPEKTSSYPWKANKNQEKNARKRASELLALVGLSGRENHRPQRLSAGEQQRVAIARALANNPAIILADEPTGNLDSKNKQEIMKLLANLNIQHGTTIIMVSHDTDAARHTERMLLLKDGKIVKEKEGTHSAKKNSKCPNCGATIKLNDDVCPSCKKSLFAAGRILHNLKRANMESPHTNSNLSSSTTTKTQTLLYGTRCRFAFGRFSCGWRNWLCSNLFGF